MATTPKHVVATWDEDAVARWLTSVDLAEHQAVFADNHVSGDVLVELTHELLKDMEIKSVGKRVSILKAIGKLINEDKLVSPAVSVAASAKVDNGKDEIINSLREQLSEVQQSLSKLQDDMRRAPPGPAAQSTTGTNPGQKKQAPHGGGVGVGAGSSSNTRPDRGKDAKSNNTTFVTPPASSLVAEPAAASSSGPTSFFSKRKISNAAAAAAAALSLSSTKSSTGEAKTAVVHNPNEDKGLIRLVVDSLREFENYRTVVVSRTELCGPILRLALRKYNLREKEWRHYALFVHVQGKERCLRYDESPLQIKQQIKAAHKNAEPMFILRHLHQLSDAEREAIGANKAQSTESAKSSGDSLATRSSRSSSLGVKAPAITQRQADSRVPGVTTAAAASSLDDLDEEPVHAVAIYMYDAALGDELTISIGDQLTVYKRATGWWYCDKAGQFGWVPQSCLDVVQVEKLEPKEGVVLYDYEADGANELSIFKGEKITVKSRHQHWLLAESATRRGWIPSCYVAIDKAADSSANDEWQSGRIAAPPSVTTSVENDTPIVLTADGDAIGSGESTGDDDTPSRRHSDSTEDTSGGQTAQVLNIQHHGAADLHLVAKRQQTVDRLSRLLDTVPIAKAESSEEARTNVRKLLMEIDLDLQEIGSQSPRTGTQSDEFATTNAIRQRISAMVHELEALRNSAGVGTCSSSTTDQSTAARKK